MSTRSGRWAGVAVDFPGRSRFWLAWSSGGQLRASSGTCQNAAPSIPPPAAAAQRVCSGRLLRQPGLPAAAAGPGAPLSTAHRAELLAVAAVAGEHRPFALLLRSPACAPTLPPPPSCPCVPTWRQVAEQQGKYLARVLNEGADRLEADKAEEPKPFVYRHLGSMASIGASRVGTWACRAAARPRHALCCLHLAGSEVHDCLPKPLEHPLCLPMPLPQAGPLPCWSWATPSGPSSRGAASAAGWRGAGAAAPGTRP